MKKLFFIVGLFLVNGSLFSQQATIAVLEKGKQLQAFYLSQHVETLWQKGMHVNWETGVADDPNATKNIKTHCSSFVASVCKQRGIYILRPPKHSVSLLANAQYSWLFTPVATAEGWLQIADNNFIAAQTLANEGNVVIAVAKNPNPKKSGHIALVMPAEISSSDVINKGPKLIQAGGINSSDVDFVTAFHKHYKVFPPSVEEVALFYHR